MGYKKRRLKTIRSLYVDVFNQTTVGFILVDNNGIIKDTNETFRKIFGYEQKSDLRDKHIKICHLNEKNYKKFQKLTASIFKGKNVFEKEIQLLTASGKAIWCEISGTLLHKDDRMKDGGILWDIVEITEKIKIRKLISKQNKELKKLNNSLNKKVLLSINALQQKDKLLVQQTKLAIMGEMLDAIAHQWKQPLSIIKLSASELQYYSSNNTLDKEYTEIISSRVTTQVDHLAETLDEFKNFLRPKGTLKSENIKNIIDSAITILRDELFKNTITVEFKGDETLSAQLISNEFKHIIINLVNNAKDQFNKEDIRDRLITFEIDTSKNYVILKVSDNSGGIPKEYIAKIFDANFSTKTKEHGTGIGLYMTKNILEKIGATIKAKNVKNGAQFIIKVPI